MSSRDAAVMATPSFTDTSLCLLLCTTGWLQYSGPVSADAAVSVWAALSLHIWVPRAKGTVTCGRSIRRVPPILRTIYYPITDESNLKSRALV